MTGKHRAEDKPSGKSTSEDMRGKSDRASDSKHRATGETTQDLSAKTTKSDLPHRDGRTDK